MKRCSAGQDNRRSTPAAAVAAVLLIVGAGVVVLVPRSLAAADEAAAMPRMGAPAVRPQAGLEYRMRILTRELGLDAAQQVGVRELLQRQRDEIHRIWTSGAVPPTERAAATRSANEKIGDEIRSVLSEEQRKKYNSVKPAAERTSGEQRTVEQWLDASRVK